MPFRLLVPRNLLDALVAQALAEQPNECCGLLAGKREGPAEAEKSAGGVARVVERFPLVNALASPVRYESDGPSMLRAHRDMRARGLDILAVYHSHPTSDPVPSRTDLACNYYPGVVHLIVSLTTTPPRVRGWWLTETDYREAEWEVEG
jgi:proteasome lid subunit RPN8/RPN11